MFKVGGLCIAVDAHPKSCIKNGLIYRVYSYEERINPANGLGPFWYIGVERGDFKSHDWLTPRLFRPLVDIPMKFEKLEEQCPVLQN